MLHLRHPCCIDAKRGYANGRGSGVHPSHTGSHMQALETNTLIYDRYRVTRLIGRGGMGAVYEAIDQRLGNRVALKQKLVSGAHLARAFEREAKLLARLQHPSLPRVTDYFSERSEHFLVMDFIPGENLAELLMQRRHPFNAQEVLRWADQILRVLEYLHGHQPIVVHRDIKPQNLIQRSNGEIVLLDFGMAKGGIALQEDTSSRSLAGGTPAYAALEQLVGTRTEPRSDIYSLAATLHHLLTGKPPVEALARAAALLNRLPDPYCPAHHLNQSVPFALGNVLSQMLALAVDERPGDLSALRTELLGILDQARLDGPQPSSCTVGDFGTELPTASLPASDAFAAGRGDGRSSSVVPIASFPAFDAFAAGTQGEESTSHPFRRLGSPALRRAQLLAHVFQGAQVLWVDDNPGSVTSFCGILRSLGVQVELVTSSKEALMRIANKRFHVIVSDIDRDGIADEGLRFLRAVQQRGAYPKVIFFIANLDPRRGTPPGAFGITNGGEALLHLVFDALERELVRG